MRFKKMATTSSTLQDAIALLRAKVGHQSEKREYARVKTLQTEQWAHRALCAHARGACAAHVQSVLQMCDDAPAEAETAESVHLQLHVPPASSVRRLHEVLHHARAQTSQAFVDASLHGLALGVSICDLTDATTALRSACDRRASQIQDCTRALATIVEHVLRALAVSRAGAERALLEGQRIARSLQDPDALDAIDCPARTIEALQHAVQAVRAAAQNGACAAMCADDGASDPLTALSTALEAATHGGTAATIQPADAQRARDALLNGNAEHMLEVLRVLESQACEAQDDACGEACLQDARRTLHAALQAQAPQWVAAARRSMPALVMQSAERDFRRAVARQQRDIAKRVEACATAASERAVALLQPLPQARIAAASSEHALRRAVIDALHHERRVAEAALDGELYARCVAALMPLQAMHEEL